MIRIFVGVYINMILLCTLATAGDQITFKNPARDISFSYDGTLWQSVDQSNPTIITAIQKQSGERGIYSL